MCIKNTHFKCLKTYYRISRVEVTHLFLECGILVNIDFKCRLCKIPGKAKIKIRELHVKGLFWGLFRSNANSKLPNS